MNIKLSNGKKSQGLFYTAHPIMGSVISKQYSNEEGLEEDSHLLETEDFVYFSIENLEKPPIIEDLDQFLRPKTEKHGNKSKKAKEMKIDGEITTKKGINNKKNLVK